jgi:hypothetical protein
MHVISSRLLFKNPSVQDERSRENCVDAPREPPLPDARHPGMDRLSLPVTAQGARLAHVAEAA